MKEEEIIVSTRTDLNMEYGRQVGRKEILDHVKWILEELSDSPKSLAHNLEELLHDNKVSLTYKRPQYWNM